MAHAANNYCCCYRAYSVDRYWPTLTSLLQISQHATAATADRFSLAQDLAV